MRQAFSVPAPRHGALRALNYEPTVERVRRPKRGKVTVRLRELVSDLGSGYATVFARIDCDPTFGVELLSQSDMFAAEPQGRFIRRDSMQHPERHEVHRWHVLIAGAGTLAPTELYGRAIIADGRLVGKSVGQDTLRIVFSRPEDDFSLFTYAYLASPTGLRALRSASYGTKILRIRKDILAELPVPRADDQVVRRVATLIRRCVEQREIYLVELLSARKTLDELPEMREAHAMCAHRKARAVAWSGPLPTLRAWNFASTGEALSLLRRSWSGRLGDCLEPEGLFKGGRLARIPCSSPYGVDLLSQRDVFAIRPVPRRIQRPADATLAVTPGMLLLASRGQMNEGALFGCVERAVHMPPEAIVSEDITRLVPRQSILEGLYAFLSTVVGLALVQSTAYGTSIPGMRMDLLAQLPVPPDSVLRRCARAVEVSTAARLSAADAEIEAIRIVEEEVLPAWLA